MICCVQSPEEIDEKMAMYQVVCGVSSNPVITSGEPWAHISRPCKSLIMAMLERWVDMAHDQWLWACVLFFFCTHSKHAH